MTIMASISVSLDSKASTPPGEPTVVPEAPEFDNREDFYDYLYLQNDTSAIRDDDGLPVSEICSREIFVDDSDKFSFPPFENTTPIIAAHTKIWRGGHTNNILSLILGSKQDATSYLAGLLVSSITVLVCFVAWMILLITLKGFGRDRVGFLSGKRAKLPPGPVEVEVESPCANLKPEGETEPTSIAPCEDCAVEAAPQVIDHDVDGGVDVDVDVDVDGGGGVDIDGNSKSNSNSDNIDSDPRSLSSEQEQKETKQSVLLSNDEWNELYATKKKEECWMKTVVLFACIIVICMAAVMARKGVQSLRGSLSDGEASINYAQRLLNGAEDVVNELAVGLGEFQTDVLDLLERTNTGICPRLKPEGICPRLLEVDSCDFTVQIDLEKDITIDKLDVNKTIDVSYNHSVDVSKLSDGIKDKIGLDGTLDLRELLFPNAPNVYRDLMKAFSSDWAFIDKMHDFADTINSVSTIASETEQQISTLNWVFYIAVAFDVIVGLLAVCMIVHILAGEKLPQSLKCAQRRCLFPFFIACVSISFIFAIAFLIASMVLSDTCVNDPSERFLSIAEFYMGDGLAAEYVSDIIKQWISQCAKEPPSMQQDQAFIDEAQVILEEFDVAIKNVAESVTEFCGTTDRYLFADLITTSLKYLCGVIGLSLDLRKAFQCSTWMPLYYNTLHNAVCYNGIDGLWSIAATQFTTVLMACIILTFRSVFLDLETIESDNDCGKKFDVVSLSGDDIQNDDRKEGPMSTANTVL